MKRTILLVALVILAIARPAWAQQSEIAALRAEVAKQQAAIDQLLARIDALEKTAPATVQDLESDIKAQEDAVNSLRETMAENVNLNGYYNFRFSAEDS